MNRAQGIHVLSIQQGTKWLLIFSEITIALQQLTNVSIERLDHRVDARSLAQMKLILFTLNMTLPSASLGMPIARRGKDN